ncbi:MAG: iron-containing alcohol dehydrogenase [Candidatus Hydrogenedentes bacterium]|nr:iron-containing alcohol dehydrogenase [Candidatus Hydrogenedentota bacterium]
MKNFAFQLPVEIHFGPGALAELTRYRQLGRRPALICGRRSARASGALDRVMEFFPGALVLDGIPENPETSHCEAHARACRQAGVDCIIGLGGGSALDAAKAIALLATNDGDCADYLDDSSACNPALPILAIPTTAGTGSEVTPYAVLVDTALREKKTLRHPTLYPRAAILDSRLTLALPRDITVATALDALSQAMEGMVSKRATPLGDLLALEACRLIRATLPWVLTAPHDEEARGLLLYAAMLSGVVIAQSGTTLVHGMGYHYTLDYGIAHGAANALLLPPVFAWNAVLLPATVASIAGTLGYPGPPKSDSAARAIVAALYDFYAEIEFPSAARDHGVPQEANARFAERIIKAPYRFKNQIGEFTAADVEGLFEAAWSGQVT